MQRKRLWINEVPDELTSDDFVWQWTSDDEQSFRANIEPNLQDFGRVNPANVDAVWLAVLAFLTDRTTPRRKGWGRRLEIAAPSTNPGVWGSLTGEINAMLEFLTSDEWSATFAPRALDAAVGWKQMDLLPDPEPDVICLFSGGADSICGAVRALSQGKRVALLSHWDWTGHAAFQSRLVHDLENKFKVRIPHFRVNLGRRARQIGGARFRNEPSRRSRSFLFLTLGLALAAVHEPCDVWIAETGFVSLNPPLASERRAALSTRTTHPLFFLRLRSILDGVGAYSRFENPFEAYTKGEMFLEASSILGSDNASKLLSRTHSCTHVRWAMRYGCAPSTQCGVCLGCLVRRAGFIAADLKDHTTYLVTHLTGWQRERFLADSGRKEIESMRYATNRKYTEADILSLCLPQEYDLSAALGLVNRGFSELSAVGFPG